MASGRDKIEGIYRLTPTQEGILFHVLGEPGQGVYFQQFTCLLDGPIDEERLTKAWQLALQRHPGTRALFTWEGRKNPLQVVRRGLTVPVSWVRDAALVAGGDALEHYLAEDRAAGFELSKAPLMRVVLARGAGDEVRLLWSFHHLLLDGWSMRLFFADVLGAYDAGVLPPASLRFEDYVSWLSQRDGAAAEAFWRQELAGFAEPVALRLPSVTGRASGRQGSGVDLAPGEEVLRLTTGETERLTNWARQERITLNTVLRGCWAAVLSRYTGREDVVFGATVSGRAAGPSGVEDIVGMCINTLPVRIEVDPAADPAAWLRGIQERQRASEPFESAALSEIQRWSEVPAGRALFDSILVFENLAIGDSADVERRTLAPRAQRFIERSNYPLALLVLPGEALELTLVFDRSGVEASPVARLARHLRSILLALPDGAPTVANLPMLTADDTETLRRFRVGDALVRGGGDTHKGSVLGAIHAAVVAAPTGLAVRDTEEELRYGELWSAASRLAEDLRVQGLSPGGHAVLLLDRSVAMVVGILGVLLAEGVYVPLDPEWPEERVALVGRDTGAQVVVASPARRATAVAALPGVPVVAVTLPTAGAPAADPLPPPQVEPDSWAYVLYTSGSTGRPKGVAITHANLWQSTAARFEFYPERVKSFLLLSPYHFDSSVAGLFWTLCQGGSLVLPPVGGERDVAQLAARIEAERVTHTLCLPSLWEPLLAVATPGALTSLEVVIVAGEACPGHLVLQHRATLAGCCLANEYGPTEASVWAVAHRMVAADARGGVPIGRPIGATEVFVLNAAGHLAPPGVPGEIYLGGPGLAWGYVGDEARTAERFLERDLLGLGKRRLYRTGDLGRFRENGVLDFLGRIDHQVKIRGHRIELGEIEAALQACTGVGEAVVVAVSSDAGRAAFLTAYLVAAGEGDGKCDGADATAAARAEIAKTLPEYMLPREWIWLDAMPRTGTGKVDRGALPAPTVGQADGAGLVAPGSEIEAALLPIWCEVLGLEAVSADANFFELGGDSLLSIRIIARAHQAGLKVDPAGFAAHPTVAGMAAATSRAADGNASEPTPQRPEGHRDLLPLTPIQRWFFALDLPVPSHWNQAARIPIPAPLTEDAASAALTALRNTHDALRLRFEKRDGTWYQRVVRADASPIPVAVTDLSGLSAEARPAAFEAAAAALHRSLDLQSGPLLAAGFVRHESNGPGELLVVVHHLAVDAVSWQTLREDLGAAWEQAAAGGVITLAPPGASFGEWVRALENYRAGPACQSEATYWSTVAAAAAPSLPIDFADGRAGNAVADEAHHSVSLSTELTEALLREVPAAYKTQILDVLLTALVQAFEGWAGVPRLTLDLEGHGREAQVGSLEISRTVGWLTAVHPVTLSLPPAADPGTAIKETKEVLRGVPGGGLGAGLLPELNLPRPELLFNYLGQQTEDGGGFGVTADVGPCRDTAGHRSYLLEVNAAVVGGALQITWTYGARVHQSETIQRLATAFLDALTALIRHCQEPSVGGATPSDFPMAGLDQAGLDKLGDLLGDD